jgi:type 1 fimbria pilin
MLDVDFTIRVAKSKGPRETETVSLTKTTTDVEDLLDLLEGEKISNVIIYVYNSKTVQAMDLD